MNLLLLLIFAFLIRLINLNQSLWLDEAVVAKVVRTIPFHLIPTQFSPGDFHPPLYYLFMSLWSHVFGTTEIALRMPSVIFSLIAGWYVYKIGELIKNKTVGLWSAAFFLFNPLIVYYSQEARMYMMAVMLLSIALYYFIFTAKNVIPTKVGIQENMDPVSPHGMTQNILLFNLFSGLAFATFYGSIYFIGTLLISRFFINLHTKGASLGKMGIQKYKWIPAFAGVTQMMLGLALTGALLFPLLTQQLQTARFGLQEVSNWNLVLGKAELKNFAMVFIKFTSGRLSWFPKWSYYIVVGTWSIVVGSLLLFNAKKNRLLTFLFAFPLIIGLLISFWVPMMQYFRFLYLIVPMSVILAGIQKNKWIPAFAGMTKGNSGMINKTVKTIVLMGFLIFSFVYLFFPQFHREDWKGLTQNIKSTQPVYMILPSSDPLTYYRNNLTVHELREIGSMALPETIQVIPYVSEIYGYDYNAELTKKGCIKVDESVYRGPVILEVWRCLRNA